MTVPVGPTPPPVPNPQAQTPAATQPQKVDDGGAFAKQMNAGQAQPTTPAADAVHHVRLGESGDMINVFNNVDRERHELNIKAEQTLKDMQDAPDEDRAKHMWKLFEIQQRVQDLSFRMQLVSKVIEHGTSSVKQLSNTQA